MSRSSAGTSWFDAAKTVSLVQVAADLGLEPGAGRSYAPCPACRADVRGHSDRRGPLGLVGDGRWKCFRCGVAGDALDLVAVLLTGHRMDSLASDQVRAWFASRGWCEPAADGPAPAPVTPRPAPAAPFVPTERPPYGEVLALWNATLPTSDVPVVADFLRGRGYSPAAVDRLRVARALPASYPWPTWWPAAWARTWRLVTRAWEPSGRLASIHARAVVPTDRGKTRWPKDCSAGGLLMVDRHGLDLLRGQGRPGCRVLVFEGLTGLVNLAALCAEDDPPTPLLAATSGGFRALAEVPWPEGCTVFAATDDVDKDGTGDKYAAQVRNYVPPSITVRRVRLNREAA